MALTQVPSGMLSPNTAGNGPAFSAYPSSSQTGLTANVWTKVLFGTEEFDLNSNFASSRFTPTVAGYYQVAAAIQTLGVAPCQVMVATYKNGILYKVGQNPATYSYGTNITNLVFLNGSSDYLEIYAFIGISGNLNGGGDNTYFQASLVRAA